MIFNSYPFEVICLYLASTGAVMLTCFQVESSRRTPLGHAGLVKWWSWLLSNSISHILYLVQRVPVVGWWSSIACTSQLTWRGFCLQHLVCWGPYLLPYCFFEVESSRSAVFCSRTAWSRLPGSPLGGCTHRARTDDLDATTFSSSVD